MYNMWIAFLPLVCYIYRMTKGTEAHSKASKARWAGVSKEERSKRMSALAFKKWAKMSQEDKAKHAQKMLDGKKKKDTVV